MAGAGEMVGPSSVRASTAFRALATQPRVATLAVWVAWLVALVGSLAVAVATDLIPEPTPGNLTPAEPGGLLWPLWHWDFSWYAFIAQAGYPVDTGGTQYAFFPLWPLLLATTDAIPDWQVGGILAVSASVFAFVGVSSGDPGRRGWRAAAALACFPGSFALLLAYPDGLALAAAAWAAALALRGNAVAAGTLAAVAALARPNGFLLALPLAMLAWRRRRAVDWVAAAAPIAAAGAVQALFWSRSGDAAVFLRAQQEWDREGPSIVWTWAEHIASALAEHAAVVAPAAVLGIVAVVALWRYRVPYWWLGVYALAVAALLLGTQQPRTLIDSGRAALVLPLCALLWFLGREYRPWAAFATAVLGLSLASGTIQSIGRQSLFAFPVFWAVANGPAFLRRPLVAATGLALNIALLFTLPHFPP